MEKYDCHPATHPFIHELKLTRAQRIRGLILGSVLVPLRVLFASLFFLLMWLVAPLRTAGLSKEERARPIQGWRRWFLHPIICQLSRAVFFSLGFLWVKVKGRRASLKEAPVLVVAPHSSFLDMLILCPTQLPTVVSRSENASLPVIGGMLNFNQSVLVSRKDPESRKKAVFQLNERLTSNGYWPQMLMFPEGTTTNGSVLIKFKPGAFLAGVPVQPVLLHYPNKLGEIAPGHNMIFVQASVCILLPIRDTVRWTYRGTTWTEVLWNTLSQFYTNMTVEFLPVYNPSPEEKENPSLYADNVQKLMAKALGIPATDFVMEGRFPVSKLGGLSLPVQTESPPRETLSLLYKHGLKEPEVEAALKEMIDRCQSQSQESTVSAKELCSILGLTDGETAVTICSLFSKDESVDLRQVCLSVAAISGFFSFKFLLHTGFSLFDSEGKGSLNAQTLSGLMGALLGIPQLNISQLYAEASSEGQVTEENLLRVLTTHQTYQRVVHEYLQPEAPNTLLNGKTVNNNANALHNGNGSLHYKKSE